MTDQVPQRLTSILKLSPVTDNCSDKFAFVSMFKLTNPSQHAQCIEERIDADCEKWPALFALNYQTVVKRNQLTHQAGPLY